MLQGRLIAAMEIVKMAYRMTHQIRAAAFANGRSDSPIGLSVNETELLIYAEEFVAQMFCQLHLVGSMAKTTPFQAKYIYYQRLNIFHRSLTG